MFLTVPEIGESVREALVASWKVKNGDTVTSDQTVCELETDKITIELNAEASGTIKILVEQGSTVPVGSRIAEITESALSATESTNRGAPPLQESLFASIPNSTDTTLSSPTARKLAKELNVDISRVKGSGKRGVVTPEDVENHAKYPLVEEHVLPVMQIKEAPPLPIRADSAAKEPPQIVRSEEPVYYRPSRQGEHSSPLSPIRKRIAERLAQARRESVALTTFNEADMSAIINLRKKLKSDASSDAKVPGMISFFARASCMALSAFPLINGRIEGNQLITFDYVNLGIAVGGEKGLIVPVIKDAGKLSVYGIDSTVADFRKKADTNKIAISDLEGGTFSITNGGIYGSLMSTPLINPPQSAILGMHAIKERAAVVGGKVVPRPMMYLALTYDHRIVDGKDAVGFLKMIVELVEKPELLTEIESEGING